ATPAGALQLALTLEYLEDEFYAMGLDSGVIEAADMPTFQSIAAHESQHVAFLTGAMNANSVALPPMPTFDFTVGGLFDPFNNYDQFLALAQAFEDTGVRAYKGQAGNLKGTDFLTPALQIHSVEARHASQVRRIRGLKGWITLNQRGAGMPEQTQAVYDGEQNTALGAGQFDAAAQSEAYDEVLSTEQVVTIANLFIV
ncbi:MAG: ferritin-like domain-containing protein, partial [Moraxellaceae bacterium]